MKPQISDAILRVLVRDLWLHPPSLPSYHPRYHRRALGAHRGSLQLLKAERHLQPPLPAVPPEDLQRDLPAGPVRDHHQCPDFEPQSEEPSVQASLLLRLLPDHVLHNKEEDY